MRGRSPVAMALGCGAIALLLAVEGAPGVSQRPRVPLQRGVSWVAGGPVDAADLEPLRRHGVGWIVQTPFGWQRRVDTPEVRLITDGGVYWGERDEGLRVTTRLARETDIRTLLKPHVWLTERREGAWRADIRMRSEEDWQRWFASYRRFILHYARLAEELEIEALAVGTELGATTRERPGDWRQLIREVREVYGGLLTYAANWHQEYQEIAFWEELDFVGIQAYFPLTAAPDSDLETLLAGWEDHHQAVRRVHEATGRPVVFTEIGYRSAPRAPAEPWTWPRRGERAAEGDLELQARCYEAFFRVFWKEPWFRGAYFWKWYPEHRRAGGPGDAGFTPQGKPAAAVLSRWYREDGWSGPGRRVE